MNRNVNRLCSICARGGSKGVVNKNLRLVNGLPLIAHSIKQALESGLFSTIAVNSDSQDILDTALKHGAHLVNLRNPELATDTAAKLPVIQGNLLETEKKLNQTFDVIVDLDCTSPLRNVDDIKNSVHMYEKAVASSNVQNLITGAPARRSPYFNLVQMTSDGHVVLAGKSEKPIVRRQDAPLCFDMNASIYIWTRSELLNSKKIIQERTIIYEMPEERSLDIDSPLDFEIVQFLMEKRK